MLELIVMSLFFLIITLLVLIAALNERNKSRQAMQTDSTEDMQKSSSMQPERKLYLSYHDRKTWEQKLAGNGSSRLSHIADASPDGVLTIHSNGGGLDNQILPLSFEEWRKLDDCLKHGQTLADCFSLLPLKDDASQGDLVQYLEYLDQKYHLNNNGVSTNDPEDSAEHQSTSSSELQS